MALISRYIITQQNTLFGQATNEKCANENWFESTASSYTTAVLLGDKENKQLNERLTFKENLRRVCH